jgi:hypothetical protein
MTSDKTEALLSSILRPGNQDQEETSEVVSSDTEPLSDLSDKRRIKELEDQLARKEAAAFEDASPEYESSDSSSESVLIHFVVDGFTAQGAMWYRGQELEFDLNSRAYQETRDRNGESWVHLTEADQIKRYGKVFFRPGPWPFDTWDNTTAAAAEARRGRAAPTIPIR